ncbi:hypothetical protein F5Y12DRAFT_765167 [Xylaria sp. FL1777]|nr:hypothetical protein F5Y12DRAFT_765167 [Xylaria sp. FL1777]
MTRSSTQHRSIFSPLSSISGIINTITNSTINQTSDTFNLIYIKMNDSCDLGKRRSEESPIQRVSISELPPLSRASTIDIELHYVKLHIRHYAKCLVGAMKRTPEMIVQALKRVAALVVMFPMLPTTLFFIGADLALKKLLAHFGDWNKASSSKQAR